MSEDCDTTEILELLEDECARTILIETTAEPMSATTLSECCDVSPSTVYRRLDRLQDCGLVEERLRPRPDGNHHKVYSSRLERFALEFENGELRTEMSLREEPVETDPEAETDPADRFTRMWEDL